MALPIDIARLRDLLSATAAPRSEDASDYRISTEIGATFLGRGRSGGATLLVPLIAAAGAVGRSGGGFALTSTPRVVFDHETRRWEQPAAILECTDERLGDAFLVLVMDIAQRLSDNDTGISWAKVLACVEEWQALLGHRSILSPEEQLGLWGELWVISQAVKVDELAAAWCGPAGEAADFFHDGIALEVKASRRAHVHHVSQSQVDAPRGEHESYLLSLWVGTERIRGVTLGELAKHLLGRVNDPAAFLKQLARAGYSPQDHQDYTERYLLLEPASWFRSCDIPRVRAFDDGISSLRYVVTLDISKCLDETRALDLWRHFGRSEPARPNNGGD